MLQKALQHVVGVTFLLVCGMFIGANVSLLVHAQTPSIGERAARLEISNSLMEGRVESIEKSLEHVENEVSTMYGVGIGLGALLMVLQVIQMAVKKGG